MKNREKNVNNRKNKNKYKKIKQLIMSYLSSGQWTTDKNWGKYWNISVIQYPIRAYAVVHCRGRQQMNDWII